jgi:hypothetical protein
MHLIYWLYFHIYVAKCLFDVVVALQVKKIEKNECFCIFLSLATFSEIFRYFSPISPRSYIPDPRRHFPLHDIYSIGFNSKTLKTLSHERSLSRIGKNDQE